MPSDNASPSSKNSKTGNGAQPPQPKSFESGNKQVREFRPPQPERSRRPSREDVEKVAGLLQEDAASESAHSDRDGRLREARDGKSPGLPPGSSNDRSADDQATRQEPDSSGGDDRPFLELDEDADGRPIKRQPKAKTILDLADEHQISHKSIYELVVPMDEGETPLSIGQMKDRIREVRNFETDRDDFADYRESAMNEIVESRTQIDGVLQALKQVVPTEELARAFADQIQRYNGQVARAREQIREYFPEWDDKATKAADRAKLTKALASYGFSAPEVDNVVDARLIRFAMHAIRLMERYQRAKESMRERVPSREAPSRNKSPVPNRQQQAKQLADGGDKLGAVAKLLG